MKTTEKAATAAQSNGKAVKTETNGKAAESKQVNGNGTDKAVKIPLTKTEIREEIEKQKPEMNLESTIQVLEDLYRRKKQRDNLAATIDNLKAFEIIEGNELEEPGNKGYVNCMLTLEDGNGHTFETNNPNLITRLMDFFIETCYERLAEIEASIVLPK